MCLFLSPDLTAKGSYRFHGLQRFLSTEVTDGAGVHVLFFTALINNSMTRTRTRIHKQLPCAPLRQRNIFCEFDSQIPRFLCTSTCCSNASTEAQHRSTAWISISTITASCKMSVSLKQMNLCFAS